MKTIIQHESLGQPDTLGLRFIGTRDRFLKPLNASGHPIATMGDRGWSPFLFRGFLIGIVPESFFFAVRVNHETQVSRRFTHPLLVEFEGWILDASSLASWSRL